MTECVFTLSSNTKYDRLGKVYNHFNLQQSCRLVVYGTLRTEKRSGGYAPTCHARVGCACSDITSPFLNAIGQSRTGSDARRSRTLNSALRNKPTARHSPFSFLSFVLSPLLQVSCTTFTTLYSLDIRFVDRGSLSRFVLVQPQTPSEHDVHAFLSATDDAAFQRHADVRLW